MIRRLYKKGLVFGIILLFIGICVVPGISGKQDAFRVNEESPFTISDLSDSATISFHIYDKTGEKQKNDVIIPTDAANEINNVFEQLKQKITYEPLSDETLALKIRFVDLLDIYGLIPSGLSKDYVLSLLNPSELNNNQVLPQEKTRDSLIRNSIINGLRYIVKLQNILPLSKYGGFGIAGLSTVAGGGYGTILPLILLPRPRGAAMWSANMSGTLVAKFLLGLGFIAVGEQIGVVLGFVGLGLTFAIPGYAFYGFIGYSLFTLVLADAVLYF